MFRVFLLLLAAHALCDYPLQGDFLARGKNRFAPLPAVPWYQCLAAHSAIHAGAVLLILGNPYMAIAEFGMHCWIDDSKCAGRYGIGQRAFNADQAMHILCKLMWWAPLFYFGNHHGI